MRRPALLPSCLLALILSLLASLFLSPFFPNRFRTPPHLNLVPPVDFLRGGSEVPRAPARAFAGDRELLSAEPKRERSPLPAGFAASQGSPHPHFSPRQGMGGTGTSPSAELLSRPPPTPTPHLPATSDSDNGAGFSGRSGQCVGLTVSWRNRTPQALSSERGLGWRGRGPGLPTRSTVLRRLGKVLPPSQGPAFAKPASHLAAADTRPLHTPFRPVVSWHPGVRIGA